MLHDIVHHEEVVGELHLADDRQLVLQPVAGDRRNGAVPPLGALVGQRPEPLEGVVGVGKAGCHYSPARSAAGTRHRSAISSARAQRLGAVGEVAGEIGGGAEPGAGGRI